MIGHQGSAQPATSSREASRRGHKRLGLLLLAPLAWASPAAAQEGGIEVFAAETLFASGTRVSISHLYKSKGTLFDGSSEVSDPLDRTFTESRVVAAIDHGLLPDLTLSALVPFVSKSLDSNAGDLDSSGLGDVALLAKWRVHKQDWKRGAFHVSVVGGVELPTGETSASDGGTRLPPSMQPGSGSWDPFLALSANLNLNRWRFDGLLFQKFNTEGAQDYEAGDFTAFELKSAYRFLHTK